GNVGRGGNEQNGSGAVRVFDGRDGGRAEGAGAGEVRVQRRTHACGRPLTVRGVQAPREIGQEPPGFRRGIETGSLREAGRAFGDQDLEQGTRRGAVGGGGGLRRTQGGGEQRGGEGCSRRSASHHACDAGSHP